MARDRDWVDYANLAANVVQTAQLDGINSKMRQLAELELQKEYREQQEAAVAQCEDILREWVFAYAERLRDIEESARQNPAATYIHASHLRRTYQNEPRFSASGFRKFEDKERLANVQRTCERLIRETAARLKPEELETCGVCIDHIFSRAELMELIAVEEKREQREQQLAKARKNLPARQAAKQAKLENVRMELQQTKGPSYKVIHRVAVILLAVTIFSIPLAFFGIIGFAVVDDSAFTRYWNSGAIPNAATKVGISYVATWILAGLALRVTRKHVHLRDELEIQIARLESELKEMQSASSRAAEIRQAEIDEYRSLYTKFGEGTLHDYRNMLSERDELLAKVIGDATQGSTPSGQGSL